MTVHAEAQIQKIEHQSIEVASQSASILQVIERAAINPDVDIEKMERLMAMHERMAADQAKRAFNAAMIDAQEGMAPVRADASNKQTRSKYASYAALDRAVRPVYTTQGLAVSFSTADGAPADHVRVVANVMHREGHTQEYHIDMPSDGKGAKGGDVMTKTHASGAAMSYGMRYLLKLIFNIAVGEDDTDGNGLSSIALITSAQMQELSDLADEVGADKEKFCKFISVASLADIYADKFADAKKILESKRQKS